MSIDRILFILLVILLPSQITKHLTVDFSIVSGLRTDYLIPSIYLTDVIVIFVLVFWYKRKAIYINKKLVDLWNKRWLGVLFFLLLLLNLLVSVNKWAYLLKMGKILEMTLIGFYVYYEDVGLRSLSKFLFIPVAYSAVLATWQFVDQKSIGGLWWLLGERHFTLQTPGIAKVAINGVYFLRPYASFSHPNVLAGFLAILIPLLIFYSHADHKNKGLTTISQLILILSFIALLLTLSRLGIFVGCVGIILSLAITGYRSKDKRQKILFAFCLTVALIAIGKILLIRFSDLLFKVDDSSLIRQGLQESTLKMIGKNFYTGVGLNNFLNNLPFYSTLSYSQGLLQPVHNTYLLIISELGILLGTGVILLFLWQYVKIINQIKNEKTWPVLIASSQMLALMFFDHYFYTLQQGLLLSTLLISFMIKENNRFSYNEKARKIT